MPGYIIAPDTQLVTWGRTQGGKLNPTGLLKSRMIRMTSPRRKGATKDQTTGRAKEATKKERKETERQARALMQSDREIAIENGQKKPSTMAPRAKRHKQHAGEERADNPATDAESLPASEAPTGVSPQEQEAADASLAETMDVHGAERRAAKATATAARRRKEDLARTAAKLQRLLDTPGVRGYGGLENNTE